MASKYFFFTGSSQTWEAPSGVNNITIECWGAEGGCGSGKCTKRGGLGGHTKAELSISEGDTLYIKVGEKGGESGSDQSGGYPNGGDGGSTSGIASGGGGGSSSVHLNGTNTGDIIVIAGGGGGGSASDAGEYDDPSLGSGGHGGGNGQGGGNGGGDGGASGGFNGGDGRTDSGRFGNLHAASGAGGGGLNGGEGTTGFRGAYVSDENAYGRGGGGGDGDVKSPATQISSSSGVRSGHGRVKISYNTGSQKKLKYWDGNNWINASSVSTWQG